MFKLTNLKIEKDFSGNFKHDPVWAKLFCIHCQKQWFILRSESGLELTICKNCSQKELN